MLRRKDRYLECERSKPVNRQQTNSYSFRAKTQRQDGRSDVLIALEGLFKKYLRKYNPSRTERSKSSFAGRRGPLNAIAKLLKETNKNENHQDQITRKNGVSH